MPIVWFILVVGGLALVLTTFIHASLPMTIVVGVKVVAIWVCLGAYLNWYLGIRRHVVGHLGSSNLKKAHVLTHVIKTHDRVNVGARRSHVEVTDDGRQLILCSAQRRQAPLEAKYKDDRRDKQQNEDQIDDE